MGYRTITLSDEAFADLEAKARDMGIDTCHHHDHLHYHRPDGHTGNIRSIQIEDWFAEMIIKMAKQIKRTRGVRIEELAAIFSEVHLGDGDDLGIYARELHALLNEEDT